MVLSVYIVPIIGWILQGSGLMKYEQTLDRIWQGSGLMNYEQTLDRIWQGSGLMNYEQTLDRIWQGSGLMNYEQTLDRIWQGSGLMNYDQTLDRNGKDFPRLQHACTLLIDLSALRATIDAGTVRHYGVERKY